MHTQDKYNPKSIKLNENFKSITTLFSMANDENKQIIVPISSTIFKSTPHEQTDNLLIYSKPIKPKHLDFFLAILYLCSTPRKGKRFILNKDMSENSESAKALYNTIFKTQEIEHESIDMKINSIVIKTDLKEILNSATTTNNPFYRQEVQSAIDNFSKILLTYTDDDKHPSTSLLGYKYEKTNSELHIIIHPSTPYCSK